MSWLIPRNELTVAQSRVVECPPEQHRLVLGSPGSGKTMVLLHRARHLMDKYKTSPQRCRILVFTQALKEYIRAALRDLRLPDDCVMTFDAWCIDYHRRQMKRRLPWSGGGLDFDAIRQAVWQHTRGRKAPERPFDFVLVDEGQDLDRRDFETLAAVAQHVTVFMDPKQKLYDERDADENGVARALGLRGRNLALLDAYRCSPYIVQAAASFIRNETERRQFIEQNPPVERGQRQLSLLYLAGNAAEEQAHLIEVLRTRIDRNERIAILFPHNRQMFGCARALLQAGLQVEVRRQGVRRLDGDNGGVLPPLDFTTTRPKLMPYPSSKGLTFDSVLMPRVNRKFLEESGPDRLERWLFVGITRASRWIYISSTAGENAPFFSRFRQLEQRKQMTIQTSAPSATAKGSPDVPPGEDGNWTDLF